MNASPSRRDADPTSRERLYAFLSQSGRVAGIPLADDTSLIASGLVDSLVLFNLAAWVEHEVGRPLDLTSFILGAEWDTITDILRFIDRERVADPPAATAPTMTG